MVFKLVILRGFNLKNFIFKKISFQNYDVFLLFSLIIKYCHRKFLNKNKNTILKELT